MESKITVWRPLAQQWMIGCASAALLGLWLDHFSATLLIVLLVLSANQLWHLYQFDQWARHDIQHLPPTLGPVWRELADTISILYRQSRKRKRKLRKLLTQVEHATAALPDAAVILSSEDTVLWCNSAAQSLLGLSATRDQGYPITYLLRSPDFIAFLPKADEKQLEMSTPNDPNILLGVRIVPYGKKQRLLLATDISQSKRVEQMQRDFVANVSHELRTPLTVIGGYLETLIDHESAALEQWQQPLHGMQQQSRRMLHIVEDLLLLVRLESQRDRPPFRPIDVPTLLADIADDARHLSEDQGHHIVLSTDTDLWMSGCERELHSAFSNLVQNAVRYTPNGGHITIRWFATDTLVCCEVEDDGEGIAPHHLPRLTERFYRAHRDRSRSNGGTGLGLSIVHHVLRRHDGQLQITSQLGAGSLFRCEFPATLRTMRF